MEVQVEENYLKTQNIQTGLRDPAFVLSQRRLGMQKAHTINTN